ncbi:MAG TPA: hypothetical protein VHJ18_09095 [Streptosporangiaceae bacterium]|nr:hypothetical protein [Streptosporangiaceae bacterium]
MVKDHPSQQAQFLGASSPAAIAGIIKPVNRSSPNSVPAGTFHSL